VKVDEQGQVEFVPLTGRYVIINASNDVWALRIDKDGITSNPDLPVDEGAKAIIAALNHMGFPQSLIASEREACAKLCDEYLHEEWCSLDIAAAIRARGSDGGK
jgi:hypothetical protein